MALKGGTIWGYTAPTYFIVLVSKSNILRTQ